TEHGADLAHPGPAGAAVDGAAGLPAVGADRRGVLGRVVAVHRADPRRGADAGGGDGDGGAGRGAAAVLLAGPRAVVHGAGAVLGLGLAAAAGPAAAHGRADAGERRGVHPDRRDDAAGRVPAAEQLLREPRLLLRPDGIGRGRPARRGAGRLRAVDRAVRG